jgi:hypothetical protein
MKLVMTLLVRDEEDILREHLEYHLGAGVDFVVATDHRSEDATAEILSEYERAGVARLIRRADEFTQENVWLSEMARLAATAYDADWVINSAADEFWFPRGSSLKQVLGDVPETYAVVRGLVRNFLPHRDETGSFVDRMTVRLAGSAPVNDPATPFRPIVKTSHRGHPSAWIAGGHMVYGLPGAALDWWYPLEILHFPLRSRAQCAHKYRKTWTGWETNIRGDLTRARRRADIGEPDPIFDRVALDHAQREKGLREGTLVEDTRLRRALGTETESPARPLATDRAELDAHALDKSVFEEAELVRLQRWVDEVQKRVAAVERRP